MIEKWFYNADFAEVQSDGGETLIALVNGHPDYPRSNSMEAPAPEECDKNGRLLAAAVDLLEACEMAETAGYRPLVEGELFILRRAIAQARGESLEVPP